MVSEHGYGVDLKPKHSVFKPFLYRGMFRCGECGCFITTEAKVKRQRKRPTWHNSAIFSEKLF